MEHQQHCKQGQGSAGQQEEGCPWAWEDLWQVSEGQHRQAGLEDFHQVVFLAEHPLGLEGEDRQEEHHQGFNRLQDLEVHQEGLLLASSRLQDFKGRLARGEDFHRQGLVEGDRNHMVEVGDTKKQI